MARSGLGDLDVAERACVDVRTVQRWCAGVRLPSRRHRRAVAQLLDTDERYLWPDLPAPGPDTTPTDLVTVYSNRGAVPQHLWMSMFERATSEIAILAYAAIWLPEQNLGLVPLLRRKAEAGCRVRIALGDPMSKKLEERRVEERTGRGIQDRVKNALTHYRSLRTVDRASVHIHATTLYTSIFRSDDEMLVNAHVYGSGAYKAPVLHLKRRADGDLFDTYAESFEEVWSLSRPLPTGPHYYPLDEGE